jgi:hypothetical protein
MLLVVSPLALLKKNNWIHRKFRVERLVKVAKRKYENIVLRINRKTRKSLLSEQRSSENEPNQAPLSLRRLWLVRKEYII